ncbi:MAG: large conductance mechanosensitive channel protein MscL [Clostridia bacterium]|nr:large conductance mechanosensitive channel protein MscL [Clostridia bacterium]
MKKFFDEFKKFITRGNVIDMAVGVIVGGAFTGIVNALSNNVLKPVINWIIALLFGTGSMSESFTFLTKVYAENGTVDLTQSIYIDWGAFINAIINFFIIAFVLFCIVKAINTFVENQKMLVGKLTVGIISAEDKKQMKAQGIKLKDKAAVQAYFDEKARLEAIAKAEEEEKARKEREENPTTEELLKQIRDILKKG